MKPQDVQVRHGERSYSFSAGELVEALQASSVPTDHAIRIARDVEKKLRAANRQEIRYEQLLARIVEAVKERVGPEAAEQIRSQTPPFVGLAVQKGDQEERFSKRTLAHSMEKFGLSFKEAYAVAKNVEQQLRMSGSETVEEDMLAHVVAVTLEARFGREARLRYEATLSDPVDLYVVESDGTRLPYSRGILARSLMPIGLAPELAYALAKRTEEVLWQSGKRRVYRSEVRRLVNRLLNEEAGGDFARRYALLHRLREAEQPVIILVGGAPGVGKSTVAAELGYRLGIPRMVSTDSVRQALRSLISKELSPLLHESSYTAWRAELLPVELEQAQLDPVRVIRGFRVQIQQLATAVNAIIERNIQENMSLVMEGIHLVPGLSPLGTFENALVVEVMLSVEDEDNHRDHFALRERQTHARRDQDVYLDHYREIRILHDYLVDRARAEGVPVVDASDLDHAVDRAMELILNALLVRGMIDGEEAGTVAS